MPARVLFIGLDSADAGLIDGWVDEGRLPNFASLRESALAVPLTSSLETLPGAIWPEIHSGISAGRLPLYFHPRQLHTGEDTVRPIGAEEIDAETFFWIQAARAGRAIAAVDIPQTVVVPGIDGIQITDWGSHDQFLPTASEPRSLLGELRERFGEYPVAQCDAHARATVQYESLLERLLRAARVKREMLSELLARRQWDLFACTLSESHCVGHQFWHFGDETHPWHDPVAAEHLRNAIRDVYVELDATVGRLLRESGGDCRGIVLASHGMGIYHRGTALLPEFLDRIGMSPTSSSALLREVQPRYLVRHLPESTLPTLRAISALPALRMVRRRFGGLRRPLESPRTRATALENNRCGAIRLNIAGREPRGCVQPGAGAQRVIDEIRGELLALRDCRDGRPIVDRVVTASEAFGADHHPDVPDLMVVFRTDGHPVERVRSPRAGEIRVPPIDPGSPRSGDHRVGSRAWLTGAATAPLADPTRPASVLDVAPTVLRWLGVEPATRMDGRPLAD